MKDRMWKECGKNMKRMWKEYGKNVERMKRMDPFRKNEVIEKSHPNSRKMSSRFIPIAYVRATRGTS